MGAVDVHKISAPCADGPAAESNPRFWIPRAAYVHVPFCRHRCGYCNFTLIAQRDDLVESFLSAVERELSLLDHAYEVDTLYFGGGTPTHLAPDPLQRLIAVVRRWFTLAPSAEFSTEANPLDLDFWRLEALACGGVNRISLGVQSFSARKLELLERDHRPPHVERAIHAAQAAIPAVSLDLIFGTPGETLAEWEADLDAALRFKPQHISLYGLTWERGTSFWSRLQRGELASCDEALERQMYELAIDKLTAAGYEHYEVSNFARSGFRCRHNESYWTGRTFFAAGPGAARHVAGRREMNHRSTTTYLRRVLAGQSPVAESEMLSEEESARERLVFGLRRLEGIELQRFADETGYTVDQLAGSTLAGFTDLGLLQRNSSHLRLTREGLLISDSMWPKLLVP